ncbi:FAD/NAD(P)-binding protein [Actinosynnema pretiosum]|uniref:Pyridine nucleotide-disulfide oxidoreductase n=1 Tax=Actinosynnema pretiosum TaxID=42197 RepID=A0A290Z8T7_9PSEU|nr:FAD/NAD(P)-binding protein [Actinosynnema pretiosum]ATE55392.1 pyridine nucleotide-disulfide oxidoreductase [Actinosynnema pretiosum]
MPLPADHPRRVVIVGAGLAGTATAIRLLRFAAEPVEVRLVERRAAHRSAGVAYHPDGNHWHHVFNIQAGRMSVFREDVDDFVSWANTEADRSSWPDGWRGTEFTESGPAPRRVYADYLADRLAAAAREAAPGVRLVEVDGEVVDVEPDGDGHRLLVELPPSAGGGRERVRADHVVLATGLEEKDLPFAADVADHPAFVRRPYSRDGLERVLAVPPDASVVIVGTLLSAYDSAALLLRRGHTGRIRMLSGSGRTLRTYPTDHRHRVLDLPPPRLSGPRYEGRDALVRRWLAEWRRACEALVGAHPDVAPAVVAERVLKAWEPHLPEVMARIPTPELRALLDAHGGLLATLRVSAVEHTTGIVDAALAEGDRLTAESGRVAGIRAVDGGSLVVSLVDGREFPADLVISNFGREPDYERVDSALWRGLLRTGLAVPHARTGRGIEVGADGALLCPGGAERGGLWAVGGPREGDEVVRNGRLGAFSFNLAAIKNHSVGVAAALLRRLESGYGEPGRADPGLADPVARADFERAVDLDVRRMATADRAGREALAGELADAVRSARERWGGSAAPSARELRTAVNEAASARLNDLSVTPRELRDRLGLGETLSR